MRPGAGRLFYTKCYESPDVVALQWENCPTLSFQEQEIFLLQVHKRWLK